jgi:hypothetical protein
MPLFVKDSSATSLATVGIVLVLLVLAWMPVVTAQIMDVPPSPLTIAQAIQFGIDHYPSVRPTRAVVTTTELTFVIRVRQETTEWIKVQKGQSVGDLIEVLGDLTAGDYVVVRGTDELRPGTKVTIALPPRA